MSSDPGSSTHTTSLISQSLSNDGAGSTSFNTQSPPIDSAVPLSPTAHSADFTDTHIVHSELSAAPQDIILDAASIQADTGVNGPEEATDTATQHRDLDSIKEEGETFAESSNEQIDLLEHAPDAGADQGHGWAVEGDPELKRVKVYELVGARWVDQGTAFCFGQFNEETSEALLVARSEKRYEEIILSTAIRSLDVYQRQQDTLIVWTEPNGVDYALSFQDPEGCAEVWAFINDVQRHMNPEGLPDSSPLTRPDGPSTTTKTIVDSGHLPKPELGNIADIEKAIKALGRTQSLKERICAYIQEELMRNILPSTSQNYIKSLIQVFNEAEDLEALETLHALCSMMQTILMLNDHTMYDHILEDELFFGVIGMLECQFPQLSLRADIYLSADDPDFPNHKANYRDFFNQTARFHHPISIRIQIERRIHHTYRLQFLKDVVLARVLDDSTFNVLNSCIIFNQIDIISYVQSDHNCLRQIVKLFVHECMLSGGSTSTPGPTPAVNGKKLVQPATIGVSADSANAASDAMDVDNKSATSSPKPNGDASTHVNGGALVPTPVIPKRPNHYAFAPPDDLTEEEIELRREVVIFVQQLCAMGKNVQLTARMALFRALVDRGVLFGVQWAMSLPERDPGNKPMISAAGEILGTLLDHDLNGVRGHVLKQQVAIEKERQGKRKGADKAETILEMACRIVAQSQDLAVQCQVGDALKVWMDTPPMDAGAAGANAAAGTEAGQALGGNKALPRKDDPGTERFMDYFYKECLRNLFKPFFELPEWRHVQAAFRIFRLLLRQNNANIHAQIMKHDMVKPLLDLTMRESRRENLLSCSCQEYFDFIRKEKLKELGKFCWSKHEEELRTLAQSPLGGQRFEQFIAWIQFEMLQQNKEPLREEPKSEKPLESRAPLGRALDAEEESYFNADDDDDDDFVHVVSPAWSKTSPVNQPISSNLLKRKRRSSIGASTKGYRPPLRTPILGALVDYGDDDEDEPPPSLTSRTFTTQQAQASSSRSPSPEVPASPKLAHRQVLSSAPGPPPKRASPENDDDDLLENIALRSRPQSPAPGLMASLESFGPREKRRRVEEDDDYDFVTEHLSKAKKPDLGSVKEKTVFKTAARTKIGDDPPKKIKVKFGSNTLAAVTAPSPVPSDIGTKDGDTG
ncbi:hypothetical protein H0H92_011129 [Tricholoma furcatifolium]|nr:hypothetical protein H0H92_011129 [Tricholoma furcatifolium]